MIQDIAPHQYQVAYVKECPKDTDYVVIYENNGMYCKKEKEEIFFFTVLELKKMDALVVEQVKYLFQIDEDRYYELRSISQELKEHILKQHHFVKIEELRVCRPLWKAYGAVTGYQIHKWYNENQFCGKCGNKMKAHKNERAMQCPHCNHLSYPKISPCVIVAVTNKDQILLTRYNRSHSRFQRYGLVAGFAEVGESLEEVVKREVFEEVGLKVKNIRYYKSQPWSFSDTLLVGFFCEQEGEDHVRLEEEELSEATWFHRDQLPIERSDGAISLTGELMDAFARGEF